MLGLFIQHYLKKKPMKSHKLRETWLKKLYEFRGQGLHITDVNPVSALAEHIEEEIYKEKVSIDDLQYVINLLSTKIWRETVKRLREQTHIDCSEKTPIPELAGFDITKPIYRAVFTAHPVFALQNKSSNAICECADKGGDSIPNEAFFPRERITLFDEHDEVMECAEFARNAIDEINKEIILSKLKFYLFL